MIKFVDKLNNLPRGKTYLAYVGQAGFIVISASGEILGIDLYLSDCVEQVENDSIGFKRQLPKILSPDEIQFDCLITTHFHRDHYDVDSIPIMMKNKKTHLIAAYDCETDINKKWNYQLVRAGDKEQYKDFSFSFTFCDHGEAAPKAIGVVVHIDGKVIYQTGDTSLHLDWDYKAADNLNVLIAPINGAYGNLNEEECSLLSKKLGPKLTIPCHYGMFANHGGDLEKFKSKMKEICPENKYAALSQGDVIEL